MAPWATLMADELRMVPPEVFAAVPFSSNVPALTVVVPEYVFTPASWSSPAPALVMPCVPASSRLIVAFLAVPRVLTVIVGVPLPTPSVRMLVAEPLLERAQPPAVAVVMSPKVRLPIVRAESSWTVLSAARSSVAKFAVKPEPSAMVVPLQFAPSLQRPPVVALVQVPSAADARGKESPVMERPRARGRWGFMRRGGFARADVEECRRGSACVGIAAERGSSRH